MCFRVEGEGAAMSKKAAAAATPAAGVAALACGNAACGKALAPPLLQCSKCKAEAYCCKACQRDIGVYWYLFSNHYTRKCIHKK